MDFAHNGCLQDILRKQRVAFEMNDLSQNSPLASKSRNVDLTSRDLTIFALHIASGMDYISSKDVSVRFNDVPPYVYRKIPTFPHKLLL